MTWTHEADLLLVEMVARGLRLPEMLAVLAHFDPTLTRGHVVARITFLSRTETLMRAALKLRAEGRT